MSESDNGGESSGPLGRTLASLCAALAILGGLLLLALALMTCVSIAGRLLFSAPVPGDFELIEVGCAIAVFAFLPYCQITGGNVAVEVFIRHAAPRFRAVTALAGNAAFAAIAALLTWRGALGGFDLYRYEESTMVLGLPLWCGFVPATFCLAVLTLACLHCAAGGIRTLGRQGAGTPPA